MINVIIYLLFHKRDACGSGGSTYLGKGFLQLTGKDKYKRISEAWNKKYPNDKKVFHGKDINLLENNIEVALKASLLLWNIDEINIVADKGLDGIGSVTKKVNGGDNGLDTREKHTKKAFDVFGAK